MANGNEQTEKQVTIEVKGATTEITTTKVEVVDTADYLAKKEAELADIVAGKQAYNDAIDAQITSLQEQIAKLK